MKSEDQWKNMKERQQSIMRGGDKKEERRAGWNSGSSIH